MRADAERGPANRYHRSIPVGAEDAGRTGPPVVGLGPAFNERVIEPEKSMGTSVAFLYDCPGIVLLSSRAIERVRCTSASSRKEIACSSRDPDPQQRAVAIDRFGSTNYARPSCRNIAG
jgi:hypothetical protein